MRVGIISVCCYTRNHMTHKHSEQNADILNTEAIATCSYYSKKKGKGKATPLQALGRPLGFQEVEAPRISRHLKVVRLSALRTGRLYSQGKIPGTHFY